MRTHLTYWYEGGAIWRWANAGEIRMKFEPVFTDREEALRIRDQHAESAKAADFFQRRAIELRDEIEAAITSYDAQFNARKVA